MGVIYYALCHDCKEYIDLDKFYSWNAYLEGDYADIDQENLDDYKNNGFVYRSLRLHFFMSKHPGHRIEVINDGSYVYDLDDYKEVYPYPKKGDSITDVIDFTDPKAGRLIIETSLGKIYIDNRNDDINCFRFISGNRVDTLLLKK